MNSRELPLDRLATTDQEGRRVYLYPADVRGKWRSRRSWLSALLIVIFLVLPWVRIAGRPAILLDVPGGRFSILGLMFWAHDAPKLLFIFGGAVLTIAFITAVWGRAWCGWACPQTVFVDSVFRRIERWIEGDSVERKRRDQGPWSFERLFKKSVKWSAFALVSLVIGHSFLAYFVGTEALAAMVRSSPAENLASFLVMAAVSGGVLFDFGWFREQFCTIVCPYGRFQSVLMDDRSMVVAYDVRRGEPRKGKAPSGAPVGDCVNCYKCVSVCPTGIDIRRGTQLECIACTACIDACDDVMSRLGKPMGLIRYGSFAEFNAPAEATEQAQASHGLGALLKPRPRVLAYLSLILVCLIGLFLSVRGRQDLDVDFVRAIEAPYQELAQPDGSSVIVNHFKMDLRSQAFSPLEVRMALPEAVRQKGAEIVMAVQPGTMAAGEAKRLDVFVRFPKSILELGRVPMSIAFETQSAESGVQRFSKEVKLVGPLK